MLGMGLMLFSLRALRPGRPWRDGVINFAFWSMNIGLMAMVLLSLLPVGLMQTWASVEHGYWYARSAEFLQTDLMSRLRWMRDDRRHDLRRRRDHVRAVRPRPVNRAVLPA